MNILKKVVKKGSQIGRDWAESNKDHSAGGDDSAKAGDPHNSSVQAALSNKQLLIDKIGQLLQYYNEKELKTHADKLRTDDKESFYSMLLVEQQHYYESQLGQELAVVRDLKTQLLKKLNEVDKRRSRSPSRDREAPKETAQAAPEDPT